MYAPGASDRQDLYQEIVIQLWKAYPKFRGASGLSTWMYRVAINTAITHFRKQKDFITSYEPDRLPVQAAEVSNAAEEQERLDSLYRAIDTLNPVEKAIIMLYLEDRSYGDMEEILGIGQGNLRVKMSRIKDKIRQITQNA